MTLTTEDPRTAEELRAYIERLEQRLEIDRISVVRPAESLDPKVQVLARAERIDMLDSGLDGIGCRDETIRLQDAQIDAMALQLCKLKSGLAGLVAAGREDGADASAKALGAAVAPFLMEMAAPEPTPQSV